MGIIIINGDFRPAMNPPIKKLAIIFLIAAVLTSSLALGTSFLFNRGVAESATTQAAGENVPGNAFREPTEADLPYGAGPNGQNLTEEIASIYARALVQGNPEGPIAQGDGLVSLLSPTTTDILSYLAENLPSTDILKQPIDDSRIQTITNPSQNEMVRYFNEISQIQSDVSSDPLWQDALIATSTSVEWIGQGENVLSTAREELYNTEVPEPFLELHKSLLATISTATSFSQIASRDPVGAVALTENLGEILDKQSRDAIKAQEKLLEELPEIISHLPAEDRPLLAKILAVEIAHAQFAVIDPVHIATTIANWLENFAIKYQEIAMSIALGYLKSTLLQELSNKVLEWAEGEGGSGHVGNWRVFLANAGLRAAEVVISRQTAALCGNAATSGLYGDIIASVLGGQGQDYAVRVPNTVGDSPECPVNIGGGFRGDGTYNWTGWLNSVVHNPISDILTVQDAALKASGEALQAAANEALAGSGFIDTVECDSGFNEDGGCVDEGEYARIVTLGSNKRDLTSKSLSSIFDLITSSDNENLMTTLQSAITSAVLSYVIEEAGGVFRNSSPGSGSDPGEPNLPTPASDFEDLLDQYESMLSRALGNTNGAVSAISNAINILESSVAVCGEDNASALEFLIFEFTGVRTEVQGRVGGLEQLLAIVRNFQQNPSAHTVDELVTQVGDFDSVSARVVLALQDNADGEAAATQAAEFIQTC